MDAKNEKRYAVVIDNYGFPYGQAIETGSGSLLAVARECANLSPEASNEHACRIAEVVAESAEDAMRVAQILCACIQHKAQRWIR